MGVIKKKPYEISIWEDRLVTENEISYYKEIKLAVIGSDKMESPNRAFDPILIENVNGEKTLTFSLAYRYHDEYTGEIVTNPFYGYLVNERKIKLFYNDDWFEFVIKECEETSQENIFKYTAKELFSLELAKLGYNVTLDQSLNNNQGTVIELAKKVLEGTDWEVDEENSDLLVQYVQEPLYVGEVRESISVLDLDKKKPVTINVGETLLIFYSFINNKITDYVQFIRLDDQDNFVIDDDNVIKSTNYRITTPVEYIIDETTQEVKGIKVNNEGENLDIEIKDTYLNNQGYRLVYKIKTTYDPVMDRTVDIYKIQYADEAKEIYHFLDYNYTTSDIVISYIANGSDFQLYEDGELQGWLNTTPVSAAEGEIPTLQPIRATTCPPLAANNNLLLIDELSQINGYLELKFNDVLTNNYENTYFNEGFEHNRSLIDHISKGDKYVLRMRYYTSEDKCTKIDDLTAGAPSSTTDGLRVIVAKYNKVKQECYVTEEEPESEPESNTTQETNTENSSENSADSETTEQTTNERQPSVITAYQIREDDILFEFDGAFTRSQNIIKNGIFDKDHRQYIVDNVVQVPSTAYVYKTEEDNTEYIWDAKNKIYVLKENADFPFADYYLTTTEAKYSFTNEQLDDPKFELGIFLYTKDTNLTNKYVYLQDIQLTRYFEDGNEEIVTIGNVPTAKTLNEHKYYLKPETNKTEKEITTYGDLEFLAQDLGLNLDNISPVFNEDSEKILSIQVSNSNYFNILQELCETFECWLDIRVEHDDTGAIKLDNNFNPIKKIAFKEYAGKDNFAGFRNGVNLQGITRNIDSNEIVTKLIVDPVQSEYSDTGSIDIQQAKSNASGQSYILNLSYYLNTGLIRDVEGCNADIIKYTNSLRDINKELSEKQKEYNLAQMAITKVNAQRDTFTALLDEATKQQNEAIVRFQKLTNWDYNTFVTKYQNVEEWQKKEGDKAKNYLENDTVMDTVGEIYVSAATLDNYGGILTNLDKNYEDLYLSCYGAKEYGISVVSIPGVPGEGGNPSINPSVQITVDDYISNLEFKLTNSEGGSVIYRTTPNDRVFKAESENPFTHISFTNLPAKYNLKYYNEKGVEIIATAAQTKIDLPIYDTVTGETYNRRFVLVPQSGFLSENKGLQTEIDELIEEKAQLEKDFYKKYSRFLQEGTWSSQDYIDPELYYFDALQVSNTSAQPKVSYTIEVLEISQIEGFECYDFRVGDKTYIEDTDFFGYTIEGQDEVSGTYIRTPVREEVIVSEIEWHFDEPDSNVITIQNYKTQFEDLFQRISATVQAVQRNEITYPKTTSILDQSGLINSTLLAESLDGIGESGFGLTSNGSVKTMRDGLLLRDLTNTANVMKLTGEGLQVSTDGGSNWETAITAKGVSADSLTAGTINTQRIWLMDGDNPSFRWDKSGLNAYGVDEEGNDSYNLKTYVRFDKYGLYGVKDGEDYVASSLDDVKQTAFFGITWKGFFIKNSYTDGEVSITSDDDFVVRKGEQNRIKIGAVEKDANGAPTKYGINIMNDDGVVVFDTGDDGNITMTGTINAQAGIFNGAVSVGNPDNTHILINGESDNPTISSSNYSEGAGTGWIIDSNGDATFSNVSVRGAIKTAVFEYEEIQAVGGAFLFRPSSTIKTVRYESSDDRIISDGEIYISDFYHLEAVTVAEVNPFALGLYEQTSVTIEGETVTVYELTSDTTVVSGKQYYKKTYNDLIVTVEKPLLFRVNNWVKVSNYNSEDIDPEESTTGGLTHIYEVSSIDSTEHNVYIYEEVEEPSGNPYEQGYWELDGDTYVLSEDTVIDPQKTYYYQVEATIDPTYELTLAGGCAVLDYVSLNSIEGGALIDFGNVQKTQNYGIGINSSDNYVNLPARAISLFETTIHPNESIKVSYDYRGILGTLPSATQANLDVDTNIYQHMVNKQGIYTDNMYIGDASGYVAFYKTIEDNVEKGHLKVQGDITATSLTIAPGADIALTYNVEVKATEIDYNLNTATLVATAYAHGEPIDTSSGIVYTWYQDSVSSQSVGTGATLQVTSAMGINHTYICVISTQGE